MLLGKALFAEVTGACQSPDILGKCLSVDQNWLIYSLTFEEGYIYSVVSCINQKVGEIRTFLMWCSEEFFLPSLLLMSKVI